ncbi:hypothetical protein BRC19_00900 [Candidatus Saccharibacteria bacterium QS_5_54_17]|nr:MAG: hypothetical protein BRC19_00900 [Candidatus Saccharibacteria bacterium QS_5_54_17]
MQPENPLFGKHNTDKIATEVLNEAEEQELSKKTSQALEHPDAIEQFKVDVSAQERNFLECLELELLSTNSGNTAETITTGETPPLDAKAEAKLFQPHDKAESAWHPGVEFATSVIGFDLKQTFKNTDDENEKTDHLLLFKLDHADADMTAKDLELGTNCRFGAFIREGNVQPFTIEKIGAELMQFIYLDPEQYGEEHTAVRDEIRMFLQRRQQDS